MNKICRTCLCGEGPMFPLYAPPDSCERDINLCDMILSLAYVEMQQGDGLPEDICQSCVEKVTAAYNFKALCERSDAVLRETGGGVCSKLEVSILDSHLLSAELEITDPPQATDSQAQDIAVNKVGMIEFNPVLMMNPSELDVEVAGAGQPDTVEVYEVTPEGGLTLVQGRVPCPQVQCGRTYSRTSSMKQHKLTHNADKQQLCSVCGKRFHRVAGLRQHTRLHTHPPAPCPCCPRTFPSSSALRAHQRRMHSAAQSSNPCPHCGKIFSSTSSLSSHIRVHLTPSHARRLHPCPQCHRSYTRPSYLRVHLASAHRDPSQPPPRLFPCPYTPCQRSLPTKLSLQIHIRHKHTLERPYTCSICSKAFTTGTGLAEHMRTHSGAKRESCSVCGGHFVTKQSLRAHQRLHTGERPYHCSECGESFVSSSRRSEHFQSKHCQRSHVCPTCGKMFHLRRTLNSHMKSHTKSSCTTTTAVSTTTTTVPASTTVLKHTTVPEAGFEIIV